VVSFRGEGIDDTTRLWTGFDAEVECVIEEDESAAARAGFRVTPGPGIHAGLGLYQLRGANGLSSVGVLVVDSLPVIDGAKDRHSPGGAQALVPPVAVEARAVERLRDYYRVTVPEGGRLHIEVVAARLGSEMDPVARVLTMEGRELAHCDDDPVIAPDARLSYAVPGEGEYLIEVRDVVYEGGSEYRYRLRVSHEMLPELEILSGRVSGLRQEEGANRVAMVEEEGANDTRDEAMKVKVPVVVAGRFEKMGDRDWYRFAVEKGQRLAFEGEARTLGSPCDVFLRLYGRDGGWLADLDPTRGTGTRLDHRFPEEGEVFLLVEELNGGGGQEQRYRVNIGPAGPGFSLEVEDDVFEARAGEDFKLKVNSARRDYEGAIDLRVIGLPESWTVEGATIPGKKGETELRVGVPVEAAAGEVHEFRVEGVAEIEERSVVESARTMPALKKRFPRWLHPPLEWEGSLVVGVLAVRPEADESEQ
jgi:hypothetical protein